MAHLIPRAQLLPLVCLAAINILATGRPARAEESAASAYRRLSTSCAREIERFCPQDQQGRYPPRSQAICLKPYKSSLRLGCRHAVQAIYP